MSAIVWDKLEDRTYEAGVSKGVFYKANGAGVPWNGLTSIEEATSTELDPVYFDGRKIDDIVTVGDFQGSLKAFTYPDEFLECEGIIEDESGFQVTAQEPTRFGLCYRTEMGDAVNGIQAGYKLHLLYNVTAIPSQKSFETISGSADPTEFEWDISAIPEDVGYYRPTAHVIFDTRKMDRFLIRDIEDILYGTAERDAFLPALQGLLAFVRKWERFIVVDNGDGTWTASSSLPGIITMIDDHTFEINTDTATYLSSIKYQIESSDKNDEDLGLPGEVA